MVGAFDWLKSTPIIVMIYYKFSKEWSDEDPDEFKQEDAKSNRRKQKAEENESQLRTEIEEAVIMLQMLRIKSGTCICWHI